MAEISPIPIDKLMAHHRKRKVTLRGIDGRVINWSRCLAMWDKLGKPVIYAGPNDPIYDLSLYLYPEKLSPLKLQDIIAWLEEHRGKSVQKPPEVKPASAPIHWSEDFISYQLQKHKEFAFYGMRNSPISTKPLPRKKHPVPSVRKSHGKPDSDFQEFNLRFLLATQPCMPRVALALIRECREDIEIFGLKYAKRKWAKFVEIPKEGTCPVCGSNDWWYRPASELGGPGERLCARCHPKPGEKARKENNDRRGQSL